MDEQHIARNYEIAQRSMRAGLLAQAISSLRHILASDPDDALAHALLAMCLLDSKRVHAAMHEATLAVGLAPDLPYAHLALGRALCAQRKFKAAEEHLQQARALEPDESSAHLALAHLYELSNRKTEQLAMIKRARELDPESVAASCEMGRYELERGELMQARRLAREALEHSPEDIDALVLMGSVHLRAGEINHAREHVIWALQSNANHTGALHLLASIKARTSPLLGLWFRYNTWLLERGTSGAIVVLIGMYVASNLAKQLLSDTGHPQASELVQDVWLAICVYTWVGPSLFNRALEKELSTVALKPDF